MSAPPEIGVILHPGEEHVVAAVARAASASGWSTWSAATDVAAAVTAHASTTRLLITVGGDGTFLLGARLVAPLGIPVLGVNRGRLGFLADVEVDEVPSAVEAFVGGRCTSQGRRLLQASAGDGTSQFSAVAVNDVVIKSPGVSVVRLRIEVDNELLGDFDADGVVIATATGSTAYALSAGGPPVDPRVRAITVVPLAPHAVMTRAVVLPEGVEIRVTVERGPVVVAADGQPEVALAEGSVVTLGPGPELEVVSVPGAPTFLHRLHAKLRFGTPLKAREHPLHPDAEESV